MKNNTINPSMDYAQSNQVYDLFNPNTSGQLDWSNVKLNQSISSVLPTILTAIDQFGNLAQFTQQQQQQQQRQPKQSDLQQSAVLNHSTTTSHTKGQTSVAGFPSSSASTSSFDWNEPSLLANFIACTNPNYGGQLNPQLFGNLNLQGLQQQQQLALLSELYLQQQQRQQQQQQQCQTSGPGELTNLLHLSTANNDENKLPNLLHPLQSSSSLLSPSSSSSTTTEKESNISSGLRFNTDPSLLTPVVGNENTILANQLLHSLSMAAQRQQQQQQQQQQALLLASMLSRECGLQNNNNNNNQNVMNKYAESLFQLDNLTQAATANTTLLPNSNVRMECCLSNSMAANIGYTQAVMMAMLAAQVNQKSDNSQNSVPTLNKQTNNSNHDFLQYINAIASQLQSTTSVVSSPSSSAATTVSPVKTNNHNMTLNTTPLSPPPLSSPVSSSQSAAAATLMSGISTNHEQVQSFNDVLAFLSHCLSNSSNQTDESSNLVTKQTRPDECTNLLLQQQQQRTAATNLKTTGPRCRMSSGHQMSQTDSSIKVSANPPHRGRGRPPKASVAQYQSNYKKQKQQQQQLPSGGCEQTASTIVNKTQQLNRTLTNQAMNNAQIQNNNASSVDTSCDVYHRYSSSASELSDDLQHSTPGTVHSNQMKFNNFQSSNMINSNDSSVEQTIDEVLKYFATYETDPIMMASRLASDALCLMGSDMSKINRKQDSSVATLAETNRLNYEMKSDTNMGTLKQTGYEIPSDLRLPLALGWRRETLVKCIGSPGILGEVVYVTPCGQRLSNLEHVREYLTNENMGMLTVDNFSFNSYYRLGDYYEYNPNANNRTQAYMKISENVLDSLLPSNLGELQQQNTLNIAADSMSEQASNIVSKFNIINQLNANGLFNTTTTTAAEANNSEPTASTSSTPTVPCTSINNNNSSSNSAYYPFNSIPAHLDSHLSTTAASALSTTIPGTSLYQNVGNNKVYPTSNNLPYMNLVDLSQLQQTLATTTDDSSIATASTTRLIEMSTSLLTGITTTTAAVTATTTTSSAAKTGLWNNNNQLPTLVTNQQQTLLEREYLKKFFIEFAKEQKRLVKEKEKVAAEQKEQLKALKIRKLIEFELKKPVEDLRLLDLKPLPVLDTIPGNRMSKQMFSNCLLVIEFLHAFTDILCIDSETIPTMNAFQLALVDRSPQYLRILVHALVELLKFAILDPGLPSLRLVTHILGQRFSDIEVNEASVSGLLRVFLIGRNGYEDEMSDWLKAPNEFTGLNGDQQAALLAFVCDELICSSRLISNEVDKTIELQGSLKREKWAFECKIRRLRQIVTRKFGMSNGLLANFAQLNNITTYDSGETIEYLGPNQTESLDVASVRFEGPLTTTTTAGRTSTQFKIAHMVADSTIEGQVNEKPSIESIRSNSFINSTSFGVGDVSNDPTKITLLPSSHTSTDEDDEQCSISELERKIDALTKLIEQKQRVIDDCSFRLSGLFLGQDRYYRSYFVLGHLGGIFVESSLCRPIPDDEMKHDCDNTEEDASADCVNCESSNKLNCSNISSSSSLPILDGLYNFDPDYIVSQINTRRHLAETRKFKFPGPQCQQQSTGRGWGRKPSTPHSFKTSDDAEDDTEPSCDIETYMQDETEVGSGSVEPKETDTKAECTTTTTTTATSGTPINATSAFDTTTVNTNKEPDLQTNDDTVYKESNSSSLSSSSSLDETIIETNADVKREESSSELENFGQISIDQSNTEKEASQSDDQLCVVKPSQTETSSDISAEIVKCEEIELRPGTITTTKIDQDLALKPELCEPSPSDSTCDLVDVKRDEQTTADDTAKLTTTTSDTPTQQQQQQQSSNVEPLDLSRKSVPVVMEQTTGDGDNANTNANNNTNATNNEDDDACGRAVTTPQAVPCLDDASLTTAVLIFMSHAGVFPPSSSLANDVSIDTWHTIVNHYKALLSSIISDESTNKKSGNNNRSNSNDNNQLSDEDYEPNPLRQAIKSLGQWIPDEFKQKNQLINTESAESIRTPTSTSTTETVNHNTDEVILNVEIKIADELKQLNIQLECEDLSKSNIRQTDNNGLWYRLTDLNKLKQLLEPLALRGIRERNLAKGIKRFREFIEPALKVANSLNLECDGETKSPTSSPRFLRVRSRRGKGRGGPITSPLAHITSIHHFNGTENLASHYWNDFADNQTASSENQCYSDEDSVDMESTSSSDLRTKRRKVGSSLSSHFDLNNKVDFTRCNSHGNKRNLITEPINDEDSQFAAECQLLYDVELLEERVVSASLQIKGWQAPPKTMDNKMINMVISHNVAKRARLEFAPLDLARTRLLGLESHLERRYLLPPLNSHVQLDIVAKSDLIVPTTTATTRRQSTNNSNNTWETGSTEQSEESISALSRHQQQRLVHDNSSLNNNATENCVNGVKSAHASQSTDNNNSSTSDTHPDSSLIDEYSNQSTDTCNYVLNSAVQENLSPGLIKWRQNLVHATDMQTVRNVMRQLIRAIAWDKSIMRVLCQICRRDNNEAQLLLCDGCDHGYHTYCFRPQLSNIPSGDWFCFDCISKATGQHHCYVCGNRNSESSSTDHHNTNKRLAVCDQCSRAVHGYCSRPSFVRIPKQWFCSNCVSVKQSKSNYLLTKQARQSGRKQMNVNEVGRIRKRKLNTNRPEYDNSSLTNKLCNRMQMKKQYVWTKKRKYTRHQKLNTTESRTESNVRICGGYNKKTRAKNNSSHKIKDKSMKKLQNSTKSMKLCLKSGRKRKTHRIDLKNKSNQKSQAGDSVNQRNDNDFEDVGEGEDVVAGVNSSKSSPTVSIGRDNTSSSNLYSNNQNGNQTKKTIDKDHVMINEKEDLTDFRKDHAVRIEDGNTIADEDDVGADDDDDPEDDDDDLGSTEASGQMEPYELAWCR